MRNGVIVGGNWLLDFVKIIDEWPEQDALASILSQSVGNGGGPYNLAKDLRRMGAAYPIEAIGMLGSDANGDAIEEDLQANKIATHQLRRTKERATSYTDVMTVAKTGRRTFFHNKGSNSLLKEEHFDFSDTQARLFYLGYLLLLDGLEERSNRVNGYTAVLRKAREAGLKTVADMVSAPHPQAREIVQEALPEIDYLCINELEASNATGVKIPAESGKEQSDALLCAAKQLLGSGVREAVVIHLPKGSLAVTKTGECFRQGSTLLPKERIAGTVGAGDAFAAGVVHGLHEGKDWAETLKLGVCIAASCLLHPTASYGVLPLEEALALGKEYGFREF